MALADIKIRALFANLFVIIALSLAIFVPAALAQTGADEDKIAAPKQTASQEQTASQTPLTATSPQGNVIDLDDADVKAALADVAEAQARLEESNRALAQAALAAQGAQAAKPAGPKNSIIPKTGDDFKALGVKILNKLKTWLTSSKFLAQLGAVVGAWFLSPILAKIIKSRVPIFSAPPTEDAKLKAVKSFVFRASTFLRAILLVVLLAIAAIVLKAIPALGEDWLVKLAQGLAVVLLVYKVIKEFIKNPLFQKLALWIVIPLAILMVIGYFDDLITLLEGATFMEMGDTPISAMTLIRLGVFGGLFFWLGGLSNSKGQTAIRSQESIDMATREVVAKLFQIVLFIILFVLILSFAGIPLSGLVVIFSAVGLGLGFGLQPIAANFISGLIILFDRTVQVGDFVVLPDGQEGFVEAINMRSTTVETTDGKDIMVPNTKFTEEAYENWTHKDPRQRYEVHFMVAYDTDIDTLEDILIPEVLKHKSVLKEPEMPDLEFREFADNGIKMAIEFWCDGIDDGPNKFSSDLNFIVWRALRDHGIKIPFPQREVHIAK